MNDTIPVPKKTIEVLFAILLMPVVVLSGAWALWMLWGWFALPAWGTLTFAQAVGLSLLLNFAKASVKKSENTTPAWASIAALIGGHVLTVGIGGILRLCGAGS